MSAAGILVVDDEPASRKIEDDPAHPTLLITEPGVGYRLLSPATGE